MQPSPQNCIWKEKPKENLLAQKQITYGGEWLHFEQQGKHKTATPAKKKKKDIYKEKKKKTRLAPATVSYSHEYNLWSSKRAKTTTTTTHNSVTVLLWLRDNTTY